MASEIIMSEMYCLEMIACGHHIQKQVWTPVVDHRWTPVVNHSMDSYHGGRL